LIDKHIIITNNIVIFIIFAQKILDIIDHDCF